MAAFLSERRTACRSLGIGLWALALTGLAALGGCERTEGVQRGYRGLNMTQVYKPAMLAAGAELNSIPEAEEPADPDSPTVDEVFKNVRVLNDLSATEFSRLMQALSTWVAPEEGCNFCHNPDNLASDEKYTKVVARRMLQMTRQINTDWKPHVAGTGVTCWTCHRGQAVPSGDWFSSPAGGHDGALLGNKAGQNRPAANAGGSSLPHDPLSAYLTEPNEIRIQGTAALAGSNRNSIKQAESTYSLMMYISQSLGVNCTYCHNTRALRSWEQSSPQRVTAWYGIRMVRSLNNDYLTPITGLLPAHRLSPEGDGPKVGCATCHKGAFKPLYGRSSLKDYPVLAGKVPRAAASAPAADAASGVPPTPAAAAVVTAPAPRAQAAPPAAEMLTAAR